MTSDWWVDAFAEALGPTVTMILVGILFLAAILCFLKGGK
jgi:hypothetical protein